MLIKGRYRVVTAIIAASFLLTAGCSHFSHEKRAKWILKRISKDLKLTETQKEQLDRYKTELLIKARELRVAYVNTMDEFGIQLRSDEFDRQHLQEVIARNTSKRAELLSRFITRLAEFHSTLTPEQRTTLVKKLDKMKKWRKRRCRFSS